MNKSFLTVISLLCLSACVSSGSHHKAGLNTTALDRAMQKALIDAEENGDDQEALLILQRAYTKAPDDAILGTRYAKALRQDNQINKAIETLKPFVDSDPPHPEAVTEMAMTQVAVGNYNEAEKYSTLAIDLDPKNAHAYLARGTALDAQRKHEEAEAAFREGVKYWRGDPSPILNNLALNLASQGHLKEALSLLERAIEENPKMIELERNRRIISTLLETTQELAPAPIIKPDIKPNKKTDPV